MKKMEKMERIKAAINGEEVDRVPISLWQHFPWADQDPASLAKTQISFQQKFDLDFIKVMPYGLYSTADYQLSNIKVFGGFEPPVVDEFGVDSIEEWAQLPVLDPFQGDMGKQIQNLEELNKGLKGEVPFVQTVFSPLTTLVKLGGDRLFTDMEENPDVIHKALKSVTETAIKFTEASLDRGAAGVFFATQNATTDRMNEKKYREFGLKYDKIILETIKDDSWFNIYHLHGCNIMTDIIKDLPVQCVNWHDRRTSPTLKEGLKVFKDKCLIGGINETKTIIDGTLQQITEEVYDAIKQTGGERLIIGPGCIAPTRTPHLNYYAARLAVETFNSEIKVDFIA